MADAVGAPPAPRKALFKPSTKTPPVRKFKSRSVKPAGTETPGTPNRLPSKAGTATPGTDSPKVFRSVSKSSQLSRTSSKAGNDENAKPPPETPTRPSKAESEPSKLGQDYAASDTTGDTATGTVNDDVFTPDTVRSNDAPHALSRKTSEALAADQVRPSSQGSGETETQEKQKPTPIEASGPRFRPKPASVVSESKEGLDDETAAPVAATRRHTRPRPVTVTTGSKDQSPQPLSDDDSAVSMGGSPGGSPHPERDDESLQADADSDVFGTPDVAKEDAPDAAKDASNIPGEGTEDATSEIPDAAGDSPDKVEESSGPSAETANDPSNVDDALAGGDTAQPLGDVSDQGVGKAPEVPSDEAPKKPTDDAVPGTEGNAEETIGEDAGGATDAARNVPENAAAETTADGPGNASDAGAAEPDQLDNAAADETGTAVDSAPEVAGDAGATGAEASEGAPEAGKVDAVDGAGTTAGSESAGDALASGDGAGAPGADANAGTGSVTPAEGAEQPTEDASEKVAGETDASLGGPAESPENATQAAGADEADAGAGVESESQTAPSANEEADSASKPIADEGEALEAGDIKTGDATADDSAVETADVPGGDGAEAVDNKGIVKGTPDVSADKAANEPGPDGATVPEAQAPEVATEDAMGDATVDTPAGGKDTDAEPATGTQAADANDAAHAPTPDAELKDVAPGADTATEASAVVDGEKADTAGDKDVDSGAPAAGADDGAEASESGPAVEPSDAGAEASESGPAVEPSAAATEDEATGAAEDYAVGPEAPENGIDAAKDSTGDTCGAEEDSAAKLSEGDAGIEANVPEAGTEATGPASEADAVDSGAQGADAGAEKASLPSAGNNKPAESAEDADVDLKPSGSNADAAPGATDAKTVPEALETDTVGDAERAASASAAEPAGENKTTESGDAAIGSATASGEKANVDNEAPAAASEDTAKTDATGTSEDVASGVGLDATDDNSGLAADAAESIPGNKADQAAGEAQSKAPDASSVAAGDAETQEQEANLDVSTDGAEPAMSDPQGDTTEAVEPSGAADTTTDAPKPDEGLAAVDKEPESSTDVVTEGAPPGTEAKAPKEGDEAAEAVANAPADAVEGDSGAVREPEVGTAREAGVHTAQDKGTEAPGADVGAAPDSGIVTSKAADEADAPGSDEAAAGDVAQRVSTEVPKAGDNTANGSVDASGADGSDGAASGDAVADAHAELSNPESGAPADASDIASASGASAEDPGKLARSASGDNVASTDEPGKLTRSASGNIIRPNYVRDQVAHIESGPCPSTARKTSNSGNDEAARGVPTPAADVGAGPAAEGSASVPEGPSPDAGVTEGASTDDQVGADASREVGADAAGEQTTADDEKAGEEESEPVAFVVAPSGTITVDSTIEEALNKADDIVADAEEDGGAEAGDGVAGPSDKADDGATDPSNKADDGAACPSDKTGGAIDQSGEGVDEPQGDELSSPTAFVVAPSGTITVDDTIEGAMEKADDIAEDAADKIGDGNQVSHDNADGAENETAKDGVDKAMSTTEANGQQPGDASKASSGATGPVDDATAEPQQQGLDDSAGDLPDPVAKVAAGHMQPADLVKYFTEQGMPEMAEFIKALTFVEAPHDAESTMDAAKDATAGAAAQGQDTASDADADVPTTASGADEGASAVQNGAHDAVAQSPAAQKMADDAASNPEADWEHVAGHASGAVPDGAALPPAASAGDAATGNTNGAADSATSSADAGTDVAGDAAGDGATTKMDATTKINADGNADAAADGVANGAPEAGPDAPGYFDAAAQPANESTPIPAVADIFGMPGAVTLAPGGTTLPGASAVAPGSIAVPGAKDAGVTPRSAGADLLVDPPAPVQPADEEPVAVDEPAEDEPAEIVGITDVTELPPAEQGPDFEDIAAPNIEEPVPAPEIEVVAMPGDPIQAREIVDGVTLDQKTAPPPSLPDPSKAADAAEARPAIPDPPNPEEVANNLRLPDHVKAAVEGAQDTPVSPTATDNVREGSSTPAAGATGQEGTSRFVGLGPAAGAGTPGATGGGGGPAADGAGVSGQPPVVDNMGKPAYVNRQINIPLPRPDGTTSSRASPSMRPKSNIPGVDDLNNVNDLEDPPEEFLDPNIHSPKAGAPGEEQETVIPSIPKIPSITSKPPENLKQLAIGLAGHTVDDVGNIVDGEGKVLGHATGDLPSMIGRMVTEGGEVYGDRGELVGYVSLNFVHPPPSEEAAPKESSNTMPFPSNLRIDRDGNILDGSGNIIGKLNEAPIHASTRISAPPTPQAPADQGQLTPTERTSRTRAPPKAEADQEQPSTSKPASGDSGIPSDIFLDVKSTPDGIQLMIRIPTIFKQESR